MAARFVDQHPGQVKVVRTGGEIRHGHSAAKIDILPLLRGIHITGTATVFAIHRNNDQRVLHSVVRNSVPGIRHALGIRTADNGARADIGTQGLTGLFVAFRRGDHVHRIDIEEVAIRLVGFIGEKGVRHQFHYAGIGSVGYLPVGEAVAHQDDVDALSFRGRLQRMDQAVLAVVFRQVIIGFSQVGITDPFDVRGILGPRVVPLIHGLRTLGHQNGQASVCDGFILFIGGRRIGAEEDGIQFGTSHEGVPRHIGQPGRKLDRPQFRHIGESTVKQIGNVVCQRQSLRGTVVRENPEGNAVDSIGNPVVDRKMGNNGDQEFFRHHTAMVFRGQRAIEGFQRITAIDPVRIVIGYRFRQGQAAQGLILSEHIRGDHRRTVGNDTFRCPVPGKGDHFLVWRNEQATILDTRVVSLEFPQREASFEHIHAQIGEIRRECDGFKLIVVAETTVADRTHLFGKDDIVDLVLGKEQPGRQRSDAGRNDQGPFGQGGGRIGDHFAVKDQEESVIRHAFPE